MDAQERLGGVGAEQAGRVRRLVCGSSAGLYAARACRHPMREGPAQCMPHTTYAHVLSPSLAPRALDIAPPTWHQ